MERLKSVVTFFMAGIVFFTVAVGALFIIRDEGLKNSSLFDFSDREKIVFLGKEIQIDERISDGFRGYLGVCEDFSDTLLPDFADSEIKSTAEDITTAVTGIISDLYCAVSEFVYGKM